MRRKAIWLLLIALLLQGCSSSPEETAAPTSAASIPVQTSASHEEEPVVQPSCSPEEELVLTYLSEKYQCRTYTAANAPEEPEENDLRLDGLAYLGEEVIYETVGVAYGLTISRYFETGSETGERVHVWAAAEPNCLILEQSGYDGTWQGVLGESRIEGRELADVILETAWGLMDIEVSLRVDGYPQQVGPGTNANFHFAGEEPVMTVQADWEPLYAEGDEWRSYTYQSFDALCYYGAAEDRETVTRITTSRSDVAAHRGIRVGDSREKVLAAYPEGLADTYWDYAGDYLCYCKDEINQLGAALLFWFEDGAVTKLELVNMLD